MHAQRQVWDRLHDSQGSVERQCPHKALLEDGGCRTPHAHDTQTPTHPPTRAGDQPPASPLIPAEHTCLRGGQLCVTCQPHGNLACKDYPQPELQEVRAWQHSLLRVTHSFIHLVAGGL